MCVCVARQTNRLANLYSLVVSRPHSRIRHDDACAFLSACMSVCVCVWFRGAVNVGQQKQIAKRTKKQKQIHTGKPRAESNQSIKPNIIRKQNLEK